MALPSMFPHFQQDADFLPAPAFRPLVCKIENFLSVPWAIKFSGYNKTGVQNNIKTTSNILSLLPPDLIRGKQSPSNIGKRCKPRGIASSLLSSQ